MGFDILVFAKPTPMASRGNAPPVSSSSARYEACSVSPRSVPAQRCACYAKKPEQSPASAGRLLASAVPIVAQGMDRMQLEIAVTDAPSPQALELIADGLDQFNLQAAGHADRRTLAVLATDPASGEVVGGLSGRTSLGLLFIDLFYLPPAQRGNGLGSQMLAAAEEEARRRGCRSAVLYTISFQAPDFYVKHGWTVFGQVPCDPPGTSRVFLSKDLCAA